MRILVAPDKFKNSLGGFEVAQQIALGLRDVLPNATIETIPMADGGEGTTEAICGACGGEWVTCEAHDALGRAVHARYLSIRDAATSIIEMSEAAGSWRVRPNERDPLRATTFGVGEMIRDAAKRGAHKIIVGLGGSATNDGGFGMARALGFSFLDAQGRELSGAVSDLRRLDRVVPPADLSLPPIVAACDVRNPLLGEVGATRIFGPQKGAAADQIEVLENALKQLADVVERDRGSAFRNIPGAGAAGGLGFGLAFFCGAKLRPGFEVVAELLGLEGSIRDADVVVTGEGKLDRQTLEGKAPAGVASLARKFGKRVFAIVGDASSDRAASEIFDGVLALADGGISPAEAINNVTVLLRDRAAELGAMLGR